MIIYKMLEKDELELSIFSSFNRYQNVKRCWRKKHDKWILKDIAFVENWIDDDYKNLIIDLKKTLDTGGIVFGAFERSILLGFASLENHLFGIKNDYLQLSALHVSFEYRGKGIGKQLFQLMCIEAQKRKAMKLYISAQSSQETIGFYHSLGCREAWEYNEYLVKKEPYDCQLEYCL